LIGFQRDFERVIMKRQLCTAVFAILLAAAPLFAAEKEALKSGIQPGEAIGAFNVIKCAGAAEDGVKDGTSLCYRCKYGGKPMVMVFTRKVDKNVESLVAKLDESVGKNKGLTAFVNVLGTDSDAAAKTAKKLGAGSKNVPVVVPVESENGPADYGINAKAQITVLIAKDGKVVANHALAGDLDEKTAAAILADSEKLVKN
jgi:hypothetical protein